MSTENAPGKGTNKTIAVVIALALTFIGGLIFLLIIIAGAVGGGSSESTSAGPACTPGEASDAGVMIPPEYEEYVVAAARACLLYP